MSISNCTVEGAGVVIWGTPEELTRIDATTIQNIAGTYSVGLYLYNCDVLCTGVYVLNSESHNTYLKTVSGSFYDCVFEGPTLNYGVLCNVPPCNPNFYCCTFQYTAGQTVYLGSSLFSAYGCAPRVGAGALNCSFRDNSHALIACEGASPLPIVHFANNYFVQEGDHFFRWWDAPIPPVVFNVSAQHWNPSPPIIDRFIPEDIAYWDFSSPNPAGSGCLSAIETSSDGYRVQTSLDDDSIDLLNRAIDLEEEGAYSEALLVLVQLSADSMARGTRLQALSRIVAMQSHRDSISVPIVAMLDDFIQDGDSVYEDVVIGTRLKAIYYLKSRDFETATEICYSLLETELTERDSLYVTIDLISIQMSAGLVSPDGRLDNTEISVTPMHQLYSVDEGIQREQDLISQIANIGARDEGYRATIVPIQFVLHQNYPNPFNPTTQIEYDLPEAVRVTLKVFNTLGQEVAVVNDGLMPAGHHVVTWDGKSNAGADVATGLYIYQLSAGSFQDTKKMVLMR